MPIISTNISSSFESKFRNKLKTKYKHITPELEIFIKAISETAGEVIADTLLIDAVVNGGVCIPNGAITGGKIL